MKKLTLENSLEEWLMYIDHIHEKNIDMDLSRIQIVFNKSNINLENIIKITVGGTNGKGSICALLESILIYSGYNVGVYSSPHIIKFNERIRINKKEIDDDCLKKCFLEIESLRENISLTYFEFTTLAALYYFSNYKMLDIIILEVGLGGRLDAVNIIDPDCSIISNVDLDHIKFLGNTREKIGFEKAHIFRTHRPAICGDPKPPDSLINYANNISANLFKAGIDFTYIINNDNTWTYIDHDIQIKYLPKPNIFGDNQISNASIVLASIESMHRYLYVDRKSIENGLKNVYLPCRFDIIKNKSTIILDVAHNGHAASILAKNLMKMDRKYDKTYAVFGILNDKDIDSVISNLINIVDIWYCVTLDGSRGLSSRDLANSVYKHVYCESLKKVDIYSFDRPEIAFENALKSSSENDRILVFGSFLTVSPILSNLNFYK